MLCTVHSTSAQTSQEGIKCTKAKEQAKSYGLIWKYTYQCSIKFSKMNKDSDDLVYFFSFSFRLYAFIAVAIHLKAQNVVAKVTPARARKLGKLFKGGKFKIWAGKFKNLRGDSFFSCTNMCMN